MSSENFSSWTTDILTLSLAVYWTKEVAPTNSLDEHASRTPKKKTLSHFFFSDYQRLFINQIELFFHFDGPIDEWSGIPLRQWPAWAPLNEISSNNPVIFQTPYSIISNKYISFANTPLGPRLPIRSKRNYIYRFYQWPVKSHIDISCEVCMLCC